MKKYTVVWLPEAAQDLYEHVIFLSKVSIDAAFELREAIYNESQSLANFPDRNPLFEMTDNFPYKARRAVVSKRYLIIYVVDGDIVKVYRILDVRKHFEHLI